MIRFSEPRAALFMTLALTVAVLLAAARLPAQPPETTSPASDSEPGQPGITADADAIPETNMGGKHAHDHDHELTPAGKQAEAEYQQARQRLVEAMIEMRTAHTRYCNGQARTPADAKRYLELRANIRKLMNETYESAMLLLSHQHHEEAAQFMVTLIQNREANDIYDISTLVGGASLIDAGVRYVFVMRAVARAAVANGDFKIARQLYDVLEDEHFEDVDRRLKFELDKIEEQWIKEIKQRELEIKSDHLPQVLLKTTRGDVVLELFLDQAPSTVAHFIRLVERGFYEEMDFYQVLDHLLALTGDPSGDGSGNSGEFLVDEHTREDARNAFRGSVAIAKIPLESDEGKFLPNSGSSQFAIFLLPVTAVSEQQTVFGRVIEGMDAISSLRRVDPSKKKGKNEIVMPPDRLISAEVIRRPDVLPEPNYFRPETLSRPAQ